MATGKNLWKFASNQSSKGKPMMMAGMQATITLNQSVHVSFFLPLIYLEKMGLTCENKERRQPRSPLIG